MKRLINATGSNRVPVSLFIDKNTLIHGAMDNFDHIEVTLSGIGGSHNTILMLFQNQNENENENAAKPVSANMDYWKFVAVNSVNVTQALIVRTL